MIGVDRRWYQRSASTPHYDVSKGKRLLAIGFGAKAITRRELGQWLRERRLKLQHEASSLVHGDFILERKEKA